MRKYLIGGTIPEMALSIFTVFLYSHHHFVRCLRSFLAINHCHHDAFSLPVFLQSPVLYSSFSHINLQYSGFCPTPIMDTIPDEVVLAIASYLDTASLSIFCLTSRWYHRIVHPLIYTKLPLSGAFCDCRDNLKLTRHADGRDFSSLAMLDSFLKYSSDVR